jgi:heme-degrading monooxygenase HmoA
MILEHVDIRIVPGKQAEFDEAVERGVKTVIAKAENFRGYRINKCIETPERYVVLLYWDSVDDHMVTFRNGPLFPQWRAIVGPFFASPPVVEHFDLQANSF